MDTKAPAAREQACSGDLTSTPEVIFNTITNGRIRGSSVMPPWKNTLTEEEISQLVAYILSLRDMPEQK